MQSFHDEYGSPANAREYAVDLQEAIANRVEENLSDEDVLELHRQISEIREYLAEIDEVL